MNDSYEQNRKQLFALVDAVHAQNKSASPSKIDAAVAQAVSEVRREKRKKPKRR